MTFDIPDSTVDIEAIKTQMQSYLNFILSMPNIHKNDYAETEEWSPEQEREAFLTTSRKNAAQIFSKYLE